MRIDQIVVMQDIKLAAGRILCVRHECDRLAHPLLQGEREGVILGIPMPSPIFGRGQKVISTFDDRMMA